MNNDILNDDELDAVFAAAQGAPVALSSATMDTIMAAAVAELEPDAVPQSAGSVWWQDLLHAIGGWPAMGGLATAAVMGVWIGISPPTALDGVTAVFETETAEFEFWSSDFDLILSEG